MFRFCCFQNGFVYLCQFLIFQFSCDDCFKANRYDHLIDMFLSVSQLMSHFCCWNHGWSRLYKLTQTIALPGNGLQYAVLRVRTYQCACQTPPAPSNCLITVCFLDWCMERMKYTSAIPWQKMQSNPILWTFIPINIVIMFKMDQQYTVQS